MKFSPDGDDVAGGTFQQQVDLAGGLLDEGDVLLGERVVVEGKFVHDRGGSWCFWGNATASPSEVQSPDSGQANRCLGPFARTQRISLGNSGVTGAERAAVNKP